MQQAYKKPTPSGISSNDSNLSSNSPTNSQRVSSTPKPKTPAMSYPSSISSATKSTAQSTITMPRSETYCLPDNHRETSLDRCLCSGGMTVSAFAVNGQPECPQTSPGTQWKTVAPPTPTPTSDTEPAVPFTTTNIVGDVQLCTSIAKTEFGGLSATECFGPTLTAHKLPYATDICSLHIHEYVRTGKDGAEFAVKIDAYDGNGGLLHTLDRHDQWSSYGTSLTISKGPLLNDITIDFLNGKAAPRSNKRNEISRKKRGEILPPGLDYDVQISADAATVWSTEDRDTKTLPHCEVGDWDTHDIVGEDLWGTNYFVQPDRQVDCRWQC